MNLHPYGCGYSFLREFSPETPIDCNFHTFTKRCVNLAKHFFLINALPERAGCVLLSFYSLNSILRTTLSLDFTCYPKVSPLKDETPTSNGVQTAFSKLIYLFRLVVMFSKLANASKHGWTSMAYAWFFEMTRSRVANYANNHSARLVRLFSTLPEHISVTMPALSPVRSYCIPLISLDHDAGRHLFVECEGRRCCPARRCPCSSTTSQEV